MEEAGDSLDDGEAPEDTIDKDDKLKCSEKYRVTKSFNKG